MTGAAGSTAKALAKPAQTFIFLGSYLIGISMASLLHISASPRGERSQSRAVADEFLAIYMKNNPRDRVDSIDLWNYPLPPLDHAAIEAKYAVLRKQTHTVAQANAWHLIADEAQKLMSYEKLLFSVPMWNWSIPFVLKHYIDVVTQPGLLFEWTPQSGYVGRLTKPAAVIYSSSFDYEPGSPLASLDHQKSYFESWLRVIGCRDIFKITAAPTATSPEALASLRERTSVQALELARRF